MAHPTPQHCLASRSFSGCCRAVVVLALAVVIACCGTNTTLAQVDGFDLWQEMSDTQAAGRLPAALKSTAKREIVPQAYRTLALNKASMADLLAAAPAESPDRSPDDGSEILLPLPQGGYGRFSVLSSPIMEPALAAQFPEIKSYIVQGIDDPTATGRLDTSSKGFRAMVIGANGTFFVDPYWSNSDEVSICYAADDFINEDKSKNWSCGVVGGGSTVAKSARSERNAARPTGATLRIYRAAIAVTGEYTAFHGGTVAGGLAAINTSLNRVNAVYERDFCLRMVLVANNNLLVYTNGASDPYTNGTPGTMINQNQTNIDTVIGSANYDIGHVYGTAVNSGLAGLGVVCVNGQKARGVTCSTAPVGDPFDIDYVAHEMGHQFNAEHTFNASGNGNINPPTAFEPGSGSTIMSYVGIIAGQNLQALANDYFHTGSYTEIDNFITTGAGAGAISNIPTGNSPPVIGALSNHTIPARTPFALTASATDANGDTLTYCWEEYDIGAAQNPVTANPRDNGASPIFRSYPGTTNPTRLFPSLQYILNNTNVPPTTYSSNGVSTWATGEAIPTTSRTMTFRVSVRDNRAGGGAQNWASAQVTTVGTAGPFRISSQNTSTTLNPGTPFNVTWDVAGTTAAPISASNVKISLSTDGGTNFPIVLAESVPNNGTASVTIPDGNTTTAGRLKVEAIGNIFFDINDANLTVQNAGSFTGVSLTSGATYTQNFDTLGTVTISNVVSATSGVQTSLGTVANAALTGWYAAKIGGTGTAATSIVANSGTFSSGGVANYGSTSAPSDTDRSLGALSSGSTISAFGALVVNDTGETLVGVRISFTAKFWRSSTSVQNVLTFGYGLVDGAVVTADNFLTASGATSLTAANIVGPPPAATAAPLDGNSPSNQNSVSNLTIPVSLAPGAAMYIRWQDVNDAGNDAGLAVDDLSLTPLTGTPPATAPFVAPATVPLAGITRTEAGVQSEVTGDGGSAITARGFVYSVASVNPTPTLGGAGVSTVADSAAEVGPMSATLTGLTASATYAVRSYASNDEGTTYSAAANFTTLDPPLPFTGNYSESFSAYAGTVPAGWSAVSSAGVQAYGGEWGTGSSGGFRGVGAATGNVLGYQHTGSTGTLTVSIAFVNNTGGVIDALDVSYLGRTAIAVVDQTRAPAWAVSFNGTPVDALAYSTGNTDGAGGLPADLTVSTQLTGLGIAPGAEFTITWVSDRGVGGGASRQIGLADFSISAVDPTAPAIAVAPTSITNLAAIQGSESTSQQVTVTSVNLGGSNITVTSTNNFYVISTNAFATAGSNALTLAPTGGVLAVRISTNAPVTDNLLGGLTLVGGGASNNVSLRGTVTSSNAPFLLPANNTALSGFTTVRGTPSTNQSFNLSGSNLAAPVTITPPAGWQISATNTNNFTASAITIATNPAGVVSSTPIFVRLADTNVAATNYANSVLPLAVPGSLTNNVFLSGSVTTNAGASLNLTGTLTNFSATQGAVSAPQSFVVQGSGLTSNVTISAPANLQFTTNTNSAYSNPLVLQATNGALSNTVFARIPDSAAVGGPTTNTVTVSSGSTTATTSAVTTVTANTNPFVSVNPTNLTGFLTQQGTPSTNQTVTVGGTNLQGPITVTAPANYEVSLDGTNFSGSLSLTPVTPSGIVAANNGPTVIASDTAGNYGTAATNTWTNGSNLGSGFGPWQFDVNTGTNGFAGVFIGDPISAGITGLPAPGFGMYANPGPSGAGATVNRAFAAPLNVGDTFSFKWGVNWDSDVGNKGFSIFAGTNQIVNVNQSGLPGDITFNGTNTALQFGTGPMTWSVSLTAPNNLLVTSTPRTGGTNIAFSTNIAVTAAPSSFRWYVSAMGAGDQRQPYFNDLQIASTGGGGGNIPNTLLYVRLKSDAAAANSVEGTLTVASPSVTTSTVELRGRVAQVTVSPNSLQPFTSLNGAASSTQTFSASGAGLGNTPITITAPTGFEISDDGGISYSSTLTLAPVSGTVADTTITVRMPAGQTVGATPSGNITVESAPASRSVAVSGTVLPPGPTILFTPPAGISGLSTTQGTASAPPGSVTVSGFSLTADITATAPIGFEVAAAGGTFGATATLPSSGGTLEVRIAASASEGPLSDNVALASGATTASVPVSGTVAPTPVISVWPATLEPFNTVVGFVPPAQKLNFSGTNLVGAMTVQIPSGFGMSINGVPVSGSTFTTPALVGSYQMAIALTAVGSAGTTTGNVTFASQGADTVSVPVAATVLPMPTVNVAPASLGGFEAYEGYPSDEQTFEVSGNDLLWDLELLAPDGFEISLDGVDWEDSLVLEPAYSGGQPAPPVFVEDDDAANYVSGGSFENGSDGGIGFYPWSVTSNNNASTLFAGSFLGDSTLGAGDINTDGVSFGLYANPGTAFINADRDLILGLRSGEVLRFHLAVNFDNGNKGFSLYSGGAGGVELMKFNVGNGAAVTAGAGLTLTPGPGQTYDYGGPAALQVTIKRTSDTELSYEISRTSPLGNQGVLFSGTISSATPLDDPDGVRFYNSGTDGGGNENNLYFNSLQIGVPGGGTGGVIKPTVVQVRVRDDAPMGANTGDLLVGTQVVVASEVVSSVVEAIALSGDVYPVPQLAVAPGELTGFEAPRGVASATQLFELSGTAIRAPIELTAPTGFEIAQDAAGPFAPSLGIAPASPGADVQEQIYVRIAADAPVGSVAGDIAMSSGPTSAALALEGLVFIPSGEVVEFDTFGPPRPEFIDPADPEAGAAPASVQVLAADSSGRIYVGGGFNRLQPLSLDSQGVSVPNGAPVAANRLARLLPNGDVDASFNVGSGPNGSLRAMVHTGNGLLVAGSFTSIGGIQRVALARLAPNGAVDALFTPALSASGTANPAFVQALLVQPGGKILIGGSFVISSGGVVRSNLARLNADGSLDPSFNAPVDGAVNALARQPDGKILIGGSFGRVHGAQINRIARLENANGALDTTFETGSGTASGFNGTVQSIAVTDAGRIYVAGSFTGYRGATGWPYLAQLDPTGVLVGGFNYLGGLSAPSTKALVVPGTEDVLVAGQFTTVSNRAIGLATTAVGRITQFSADGFLSREFNPAFTGVAGGGANGPVSDALQLPDGNWLVAGEFTNFNGQPRSGLVVLTGPAPANAYTNWAGQWGLQGADALPGGVLNPAGISNLLVYALSGGDPRTATSNILPQREWLDLPGGGGRFLSLRAALNADATGIEYRGEYSEDLAAWTTDGVSVETLPSGHLQIRAPVPAQEKLRQFLRLKVVRP